VRTITSAILGKPHPNGIKIDILADENNCVYDFWIYRGIQPRTAEIVANFVKKLITADAYYGRLSTVKLLLELKHYFILSCKGNYPFKQHTLAHLSDQKGPLCVEEQISSCPTPAAPLASLPNSSRYFPVINVRRVHHRQLPPHLRPQTVLCTQACCRPGSLCCASIK